MRTLALLFVDFHDVTISIRPNFRLLILGVELRKDVQ